MSNVPLMPKATAVWLVDNTSLSFDQIAHFCNLHLLEVKAIADGESTVSIRGINPLSTGQLTRTELEKAQNNPDYQLKLAETRIRIPAPKKRKARYTPLSKRQDRPNAIYWLVRSHPELRNSQIIRLVGTTKNTIESIRTGQHWNSANLTPVDPVTLGLCTQIALDFEVEKATANLSEEVKTTEDATLIPASETQLMEQADTETSLKREEKEEKNENMDSVFADFSSVSKK